MYPFAPSRPTPVRIAAASASALLLAAALAGCGSSKSDSKDSGPKVTRLSSAHATDALLTLGNLGGTGFKEDTSADHDSPAPGCLTAFDKITDKSDAPTHEVRDFAADNESGFPLVSSYVDSYGSVDAAKKALEKFRTDIAKCTDVDDTDTDGTETSLRVSTDDEKTESSVDDQVNLKAIGSISGSGGASPLGLWLSAVRIDNHITIVTVGDLDTQAPGDINELVKIVDDRLVAVAKGDKPDDTAVAGE